MKLEWSKTARDNLASIRDYISPRSSTGARRLILRIVERCEQAAEFPMSGHAVPEFNYAQIRQVVVDPYRIIYHLEPDKVTIIAIIHAAQDWPGSDLMGNTEHD